MKSWKSVISSQKSNILQDFPDSSDVAQGCKTYDEYISKMSFSEEYELAYLGLAVCGNKKKVNQLTGSMPLLR